MKTATIKIKLYQLHELTNVSRVIAIQQHYDFLNSQGIEIEDENGQMVVEDYKPSEEEVIDSIAVNNYYFYSTGEMAHVIQFTGDHPLSGSTVYQYKGHKTFI